MVPGEKPANLSGLDPSPSPGSSLLFRPCAGNLGSVRHPSLRRSQAVLTAQPFEDNSCSFLSLPVLQAEHLQLFSQASGCFPAHSSIPPSLPGPELALDTDISLMGQPCGSTVCGDNRQESKKVSSHRKRGLPAGLGYVRCGDRAAWFIQTKGFSSPVRSVPETHIRGHTQEQSSHDGAR